MQIHRAISIRQPFVELILRGSKREEYRSQPTRIRERVYLYASLQPFDAAEEWAKVDCAPGALPVGLILGSVEIVDCRLDPVEGCYAYVLRNPVRLAHPLKPLNQPQPVFWRPVFMEAELAAWKQELAKPDRHWKTGHSAMTAAACWESAAERLPPEIQDILDRSGVPEVGDLRLLIAIPEWQVPLPGGSRPSCTDVLALGRNGRNLCVIAAEAKAGEDFGPTVGSRRAQDSEGQGARIDALEKLLGSSFGPEIRYQLLHRTASALLTAAEFHAGAAVMLVHAWKSNAAQRSDFERFCAAMKATPVNPGVWQVRGRDPALLLVWCDGDPRHTRVSLPAEESARSGPL